MTPGVFIAKWRAAELKERSAAQEHFIDLCRLLDEPTPATADPTGDWYCFERGARKDSGGDGWADVWKRHHFAWEYKGKHANLDAAFNQLRQYALALENPPLLIVSDKAQFRIRTNWTNSVSETHEFTLDDLADAAARDKLKWAMSDPERLWPGESRQALTERAAATFAALARDLFGAMATGGRVGFETVAWFNGGLFDNDTALPLNKAEIETTLKASALDWSEIDPSILGTLFERGLDPNKRSQLGAHYNDRDKIMRIIEPVVMRPWLAEWETAKIRIASSLDRQATARSASAQSRHRREAERLLGEFLKRLRAFTVLDPACGSGNFLSLALQALKDLEHRVQLEAEALGLPRAFPETGPANVKGIEINPYAAELARVSVWIGEIQWMRRNGFAGSRDPILKPLDTIECRDAVLSPEGGEPEWPSADVVVGNPPFLGNRKLRSELGNDYAEALSRACSGLIHGKPDLVCYWFAKAGRLVAEGKVERAGLVATNSIRGGTSRLVLERILKGSIIFDAWSDEPWVIEGAAVRVSLLSFAHKQAVHSAFLNGTTVARINADLTAQPFDLTRARPLTSNESTAFQGDIKYGPFDIPGDLAREWLRLPANPNGRPNSDVLKPWINGMDLKRRPAGKWIVDFGDTMTEADAALYEKPFAYIQRQVWPVRQESKVKGIQDFWWQHWRPRPAMWRALSGLSHYIATPRVAKHRLFVWCDVRICPDSAVVAIARDDDTTFGILHSRFHEVWSLGLCTWLGVGNDPRYTPTTTFGTFPFPEGLSPDIPASDYANDSRAITIAEAARRLVDLRDRWLNPTEWVEWVDEPVPGYPKRPVPRDETAAQELKKRTLTNLYNVRPQWLADAHAALDAAVAAAYGWDAAISDDEALQKLLALNLGASTDKPPEESDGRCGFPVSPNQ